MSRLGRCANMVVAFCACMSAASLASAASRQAVFVGVGKYHPDTVERVDLDGPPNDVALMRAALRFYGFDDDNSTVLVDRQATHDAILAAVENKLLTQDRGSLAVFYFSGHGSALRSKNDVGEFNDETIVPYDGRVRGQPDAEIIDDQIYAWIREFDRKGITAVLIFDSCLSGGIARPGIEVRRMPPVEAGQRPMTDGILNFRQLDGIAANTPIVVLTASKASDFAYSKKDGATGRVRGVFTDALSAALTPGGQTLPAASWRGLSTAAKDLMTADPDLPGAQTPEFYGALDSGIFAGNAAFSPSIAARRTAPDQARLEFGTALGITAGSIFKLFTPVQVPWRLSSQFAALARVVRVSDDSAVLKVEKGRLDDDDYRAVEFEYATPRVSLSVKIPPGAIRDKTDARAVQDVADAVQGSAADSAGAPQLIVSATDDELFLATEDGRRVGLPVARTNTVSMQQALRDRIAAYLRWQRLLAWRRPDVRWRGLSYRIEYSEQGQRKLLSGPGLQHARIPAGAVVSLSVANDGTQPVSAVAILLRPEFAIDVCPAGQVAPDKENATEAIRLGTQAGKASFKLVVSDPAQPVELNFLRNQDNSRSVTGGSLGSELAAVWNGAALQSRRGIGPAQSDWQLFDIPFEVVPASTGSDAKAASGCLGFPEK